MYALSFVGACLPQVSSIEYVLTCPQITELVMACYGCALTFNLYTCRNVVKITNFTMSFLNILSTSRCLK